MNPELNDLFDAATLASTNRLFHAVMAMKGHVVRELEGRRTQRIESGGRGYFLKQHFGVGWREIIKNLLQGRLPVVSAKNEWRAIQYLQSLGVATLNVTGFGCRGLNPAQRQSFLLTTELTHVVSLEDFCKDWPQQPPPLSLKRQLIQTIAQIAHLLHDNGINHRDFYLCHFLRAETAPHTVYLIDLHRAQIRSQTPTRWRIKDLAGLYFSSKDIGLTSHDWLRFIKAYRRQTLRAIFTSEQNFWQRVKQRGDKMYRQHANA